MKKSTIYIIYIVGTSLLVYGLFAGYKSFANVGSTLLILSAIFALNEI